MKLDILGQKMIAFDRSQSLGGLCQGHTPYQSLRKQLADPRAMHLEHPQSQYPFKNSDGAL